MSTTTLPKTKETAQAIIERRNIRHFKPDPIAPELLQHLLELTLAAPSSWNLQDCKIVLVQEAAQKQALSQAAWGQQQVIDAPVNAVFIADPNTAWSPDVEEIYAMGRQNGAWDEARIDALKQHMPAFQQKLKEMGRAREYAIKDAMIAATHMLIAGQSLGLGVSIMNGWIEDQVKSVLGIADQPDLAIAVIVAVGYPQEVPGYPGRLPLQKRVFEGNLNSPYSKR